MNIFKVLQRELKTRCCIKLSNTKKVILNPKYIVKTFIVFFTYKDKQKINKNNLAKICNNYIKIGIHGKHMKMILTRCQL